MISNQNVSTDHTSLWLDELVKFCSLPNNVFDPSQIQNNARYLSNLLQGQGFDVQLWNTPSGKPYVFASRFFDGSKPTILFYSHYDGVPVDTAYWKSDPYKPEFRNGAGKTISREEAVKNPEDARLYGRSIADSKNAVISILAALDALRSAGETPGVNIKFLMDGEEELESPYLKDVVLQHRQQLMADLVISASGETHQSGLPTIAFGVRGILMLDLTMHTATTDMHSGHFGNFAPNAALELIHVLAALKGSNGKVQVPGFYDDIVPLTAEEQRYIRKVPAIEEAIQQQFGIRRPEQPYSLQQLINQPTCNIRGLQAGYVGEAAGNIIPSQAKASLDIRLVNGMEPDTIYHLFLNYLKQSRIHISEQAPTPADLLKYGPVLQIERRGSFRSVKTDLQAGLPAQVLNMVQRSTKEPWVIEPTEGGSLNFEVFYQLGFPLITLPVSNFDCNQHTHNENLRMDFVMRGISIFKELLRFQP